MHLQQLAWSRETAKHPQRRVSLSNHGLDSWGGFGNCVCTLEGGHQASLLLAPRLSANKASTGSAAVGKNGGAHGTHWCTILHCEYGTSSPQNSLSLGAIPGTKTPPITCLWVVNPRVLVGTRVVRCSPWVQHFTIIK
jgi:hypothetical protein